MDGPLATAREHRAKITTVDAVAEKPHSKSIPTIFKACSETASEHDLSRASITRPQEAPKSFRISAAYEYVKDIAFNGATLITSGRVLVALGSAAAVYASSRLSALVPNYFEGAIQSLGGSFDLGSLKAPLALAVGLLGCGLISRLAMSCDQLLSSYHRRKMVMNAYDRANRTFASLSPVELTKAETTEQITKSWGVPWQLSGLVDAPLQALTPTAVLLTAGVALYHNGAYTALGCYAVLFGVRVAHSLQYASRSRKVQDDLLQRQHLLGWREGLFRQTPTLRELKLNRKAIEMSHDVTTLRDEIQSSEQSPERFNIVRSAAIDMSAKVATWANIGLLGFSAIADGVLSGGVSASQSLTALLFIMSQMDALDGASSNLSFQAGQVIRNIASLKETLLLEEHARATREAEFSDAPQPLWSAPPRIELERIHLYYETEEKDGSVSRLHALDDINLSIEPGELIAICGASGHGKSSLLNVLTGLWPATKGSVTIGARGIKEIPVQELRENLGVVNQSVRIFGGLSIGRNVELGRSGHSLLSVKEALTHATLGEQLERGEINEATLFGSGLPGGRELSGGEQTRVALARVLARGSPVLILDEPTASLDPSNARRFFNYLQGISGSQTIIFVSHKYSELAKFPRIVVLNKGKIEAQGTHEELLRISPTYKENYYADMLREEGVPHES